MRGIQHGPDGLNDPIGSIKGIACALAVVLAASAALAAPPQLDERRARDVEPQTIGVEILEFGADGSMTSSGIQDGPDPSPAGRVHRWTFDTRDCTFAEAYRCQQDCERAAGAYQELMASSCEIQWRPMNYVQVNAPQSATRVCGCVLVNIDPSSVAGGY